MSTVAGLPQFVTLKSKRDGNYLQYQFNEEFAEFYKCMGAQRVVDRVSPFVKLEVVPSTDDPKLIHLRCSYNNKFLEVGRNTAGGLSWISATADGPEEDTTKETCTLFRPLFDSHNPDSVGFVYVGDWHAGLRVYTFDDDAYPENFKGVALVYSPEVAFTTYFTFAPWQSYEEEKAGTEEEVRELEEKVAADGVEIGKLKAEVAGWVAYEEERKGKVAAEELKLESQVVAVWEAFKANTMVAVEAKSNATINGA